MAANAQIDMRGNPTRRVIDLTRPAGRASEPLQFPQRPCDPFNWTQTDSAEVTIGNIMLYTANGELITMADHVQALTDDDDNYVFMTHNHTDNGIDIGVTLTVGDIQTDAADRAAGLQRYPLYHFAVASGVVTCELDYIHHGAVSCILPLS